MFNGKTHYKWSFSIAMLVHQRVPENIVKPKPRDPEMEKNGANPQTMRDVINGM